MLGSPQLAQFYTAAVQIVCIKFCSHFVLLTIAKDSWLSLECMSQCSVS